MQWHRAAMFAPVCTVTYTSAERFLAEKLTRSWEIQPKFIHKGCSVYVVDDRESKKTLAVYVIKSDQRKAACAFTTHHPNDNFTKDASKFAVEMWAFGIGKLITCRHMSRSALVEDTPSNREMITGAIVKLNERILSVAEEEKQKGRNYVERDALVLYCQTGALTEDTTMMSYKELFDYWMKVTAEMLVLIQGTSPVLAKNAIGRSLPMSLLQPFFDYSEDLVALLHVYKRSYNAVDAALLASEAFSEEISKQDAMWALKVKSGLACFQAECKNEEDVSLVLDHLIEKDAACFKLGKANAEARSVVCALFNDASCGATICNKDALEYWTASGFVSFFEEEMRKNIVKDVAPLNCTAEEIEVVKAFSSGLSSIGGVFDLMLEMQTAAVL